MVSASEFLPPAVAELMIKTAAIVQPVVAQKKNSKAKLFKMRSK
jgi:hypothetical protein